MEPPMPSPIKVWHNDTYATISSTNPSLSQSGKTIIVTGAGSGIGRATAIAFAEASAERLILIGRTESTLKETESLLPKGSTTVTIYTASVADEANVRKIAEEIGSWDVLILNAGRISTPGPLVNTDISEWWDDFEVNVKSVVIAAQAFIPKARNKDSCFLAVGSAPFTLLPPKLTAMVSGYLVSKLTQIRTMEFLAAQHPDLFVCTVQPGIVKTKVFDGTGTTEDQVPMDTPELPAHFLVWLSQPKTKFLHGKTVWANWDVDELVARKEEIENSEIMTIHHDNWGFGPKE